MLFRGYLKKLTRSIMLYRIHYMLYAIRINCKYLHFAVLCCIKFKPINYHPLNKNLTLIGILNQFLYMPCAAVLSCKMVTLKKQKEEKNCLSLFINLLFDPIIPSQYRRVCYTNSKCNKAKSEKYLFRYCKDKKGFRME